MQSICHYCCTLLHLLWVKIVIKVIGSNIDFFLLDNDLAVVLVQLVLKQVVELDVSAEPFVIRRTRSHSESQRDLRNSEHPDTQSANRLATPFQRMLVVF